MLTIHSNDPDIQERGSYAIHWARCAGELIMKDFARSEDQAILNSPEADITTRTDLVSEKFLVDSIIEKFPQDGILSEEGEQFNLNSQYTWHIDPLDGSSNFSMRIPYFGLCLSIQYNNRTQFACICNPNSEQIAYAAYDGDAFVNDKAINIQAQEKKERLIGFYIQGYGVSNEQQISINQVLLNKSKRVINTWAPSIDWMLLLLGRADYIIAYSTEIEDFMPGAFIYQRAGGVVVMDGLKLDEIDMQLQSHVTAFAGPSINIETIRNMLHGSFENC